MVNPGGNYPGRQIFLGGVDGRPAFVYLVTGRSSGSKERYVTPFLEEEKAIRVKPIKPTEPFDPFRHYQAVRIDTETGLLVVSNSQAPNDAVFEAFKLGPDDQKYSPTSSDGPPESPRLRKILAAIGPEYDNLQKPTPRIVGSVIPFDKRNVGVLGITTKQDTAHAPAFDIDANRLLWVATYNGQVDYESFDVSRLFTGGTIFETGARTAEQLVEEIYAMSNYSDPTYGDLRVCAVAGVRNGNGLGGWELARKNRHNVE